MFVRGLLFSPTELKPKFVEILLQQFFDKEQKKHYYAVDFEEYFGDTLPASCTFNGGSRTCPLSNTLSAMYRNCFKIDGSMPNNCIYTITGGQAPWDWRGPVIIIKLEGLVYSIIIIQVYFILGDFFVYQKVFVVML